MQTWVAPGAEWRTPSGVLVRNSGGDQPLVAFSAAGRTEWFDAHGGAVVVFADAVVAIVDVAGSGAVALEWLGRLADPGVVAFVASCDRLAVPAGSASALAAAAADADPDDAVEIELAALTAAVAGETDLDPRDLEAARADVEACDRLMAAVDRAAPGGGYGAMLAQAIAAGSPAGVWEVVVSAQLAVAAFAVTNPLAGVEIVAGPTRSAVASVCARLAFYVEHRWADDPRIDPATLAAAREVAAAAGADDPCPAVLDAVETWLARPLPLETSGDSGPWCRPGRPAELAPELVWSGVLAADVVVDVDPICPLGLLGVATVHLAALSDNPRLVSVVATFDAELATGAVGLDLDVFEAPLVAVVTGLGSSHAAPFDSWLRRRRGACLRFPGGARLLPRAETTALVRAATVEAPECTTGAFVTVCVAPPAAVADYEASVADVDAAVVAGALTPAEAAPKLRAVHDCLLAALS